MRRLQQEGQRQEEQAAIQQALAQLQEQRDAIARAARPNEPAGGTPAGTVAAPPSAAASASNATGGSQPPGSTGNPGTNPGGSQGQSGSTNPSGGGSGAGSGAGSAPGGPTIYAPPSGPAGPREVLPGQSGPGTTRELPPGSPNDNRAATVPYREVLRDYATQAAAALQSSYIPTGLRNYVKEYFSSLERSNP
jgi:type II secretory pathway pseudopilin PulG